MYEAITPGSLIRIEFEQPLRGITISAFEVVVLNVTLREGLDKLIVSVKLDPFTKRCGELMFCNPTGIWTFCIPKKTLRAKLIPVRNIVLLD